MSTSIFLVISYDIIDDKRRLKVARLLLDYGAQRVQRSVFEGYITAQHLTALRQRLLRVIDAEEDSVRFYRLCRGCQADVERMGVAQPIDEPGLLIV